MESSITERAREFMESSRKKKKSEELLESCKEKEKWEDVLMVYMCGGQNAREKRKKKKKETNGWKKGKELEITI